MKNSVAPPNADGGEEPGSLLEELGEDLVRGGRSAVIAQSPWRLAWNRLRRDRVAMASALVIILIMLMAILAPLIAAITGHGPQEQFRETGLTIGGLPVGPGREFWLGTDNLGRDLLVRIAYGARASLVVGILSTTLASLLGVLIGVIAGYFGGVVDSILARAMDVVLSFPYLLAAIALVAIVGPSLEVTVIVIAFFAFASVGRIVRGQTLSLKSREFVEASRSVGSGRWRTMFVDILPNLIAPVLIYATLLIPVAIIFAASLEFLGLGVPPPTATWGGMLSNSVRYYQFAWWFVVFPGVALLLTTLAFNLFGDGVRDALAPEMQSRRN